MKANADIPDATPAPVRIAHWTGLVAFAVLMAVLGADVWQSAARAGIWWSLPLVGLVAYVLADFVSGFVHFLADNFAEADTPVIGPTFVRPFRDHHRDPLLITQHDFVHANGNNVLVALPMLILVWWAVPVSESGWAAIVGGFAFFFLLAIFLTNQFHKWAHMATPPRLVERLQAAGLILGKDHHEVHHTRPYNTYYCITVGLWNPLLDRTRFFDHLERAIRRWTPGTDPRTRVRQELDALHPRVPLSVAANGLTTSEPRGATATTRHD